VDKMLFKNNTFSKMKKNQNIISFFDGSKLGISTVLANFIFLKKG
jgi:hypothetical protein